MTEGRETRQRAVEAAARALAEHEPIAGGMWCHCLPVDEEGYRGDALDDWDGHIADSALAAAVPVVLDDYLDALTASLTPDARDISAWHIVGPVIERLRATDVAWRVQNGWSRD